ncbi:MAG: conjugal transfer protein TraX [Clostridia bacterium]|nr:conjugal transfer protein TraX [Clostridia bacterium]
MDDFDTNSFFKPCLSATALKVIALVAMTIDHVGLFLMDNDDVMRSIGRLAFPIFAYLVGEGCRRTRSIKNYFLRLFIFGAATQTVFYIAERSLEMSMFVTFAMSVAVCAALRFAENSEHPAAPLAPVIAIAAAFAVCFALPKAKFMGDFSIEYSMPGVMIPVGVYAARSKTERLTVMAAGIAWMVMTYHGGVNWYAFFALVPIFFYNGERGGRGTAFEKYFFYVYYPLHLVVIRLIGTLNG